MSCTALTVSRSVDSEDWQTLCRLYPDSNMIGGRRIRKNIVGGNVSSDCNQTMHFTNNINKSTRDDQKVLNLT